MGKELVRPPRFTLKQHVFPAASIKRFESETGVRVFSKNLGKSFSANRNNPIFIVRRVWDERTETVIGKQIEDKFQGLARSIISGSTTVIGHFEKTVVEDFYSLWCVRHDFKVQGLPDISMNGISGTDLNEEQEAVLESKGVIFARPDGIMPGRFMAGIRVVRSQDIFRQSVRGLNWGVLRSAEGEFIAPDCYSTLMIVPVTPQIILAAGQENSFLTYSELAIMNRCAIKESHDYYYARDFGVCPVISNEPPRIKRLFEPEYITTI
ncbi:hypothetical protein [Pseudomonas sp. LRF_L74]|uniref:hypothetical protein n=1 Tax=Pseudomonas sp. LRF_L74 TaxID=3369422 RepID=UPI003F636C58